MQREPGSQQVAAGQRRDAAGPANGGRVAVFNADARLGKPVDIRCNALLAAVGAEPLLAQVVQQHEHQVRPLGFTGGRLAGGCRKPRGRHEQDQENDDGRE